MPPPAAWCGRQILWLTDAARAEYPPACPYAPSVSKRATTRGTTSTCSSARREGRATAGTRRS